MELLPAGIIVAALGGLAIGVERQWSGHATGPRARFAGIRTFTLLGAVGGVAGWLWTQQVYALATVLLAAGAALVVAAYIAASRAEVDGTTEVGAIVVLGTGALSGLGHITLASGIVAVTTLILLEKSRLHAFVERLDDEELRAAARFAVMAVVVLPLLPAGPYGPLGGVRPRDIWLLVLFVSGLSFAGYIARRAIGASRGYPLAGLLGGLVSSTNVTLMFSRASRDSRQARIPLAYGVVAACTVLFVRVAITVSVLNSSLAWTLLPYLGPPFVVGVLILATGFHDARHEPTHLDVPTNPLQIGAALQMAAMFQAVLFAVDLMRRFWGDAGVIVSGAVLGLTDMDALTIAMARGASSGIPLEVAARAVATGILANTALKLALAVVIGRARFRRVVGASLAAIGLAIGASLALQ
ncbi:MAG: MgtC/SapB family protein [Vicinamibacterales bacterium]